MAPSHCTLLVVLLLLVTIMLVTITHRVFALTTSRVSRQNTDDQKSQSPQHHDDDHKSRSQQDFEDHKSLSHQDYLKSTAHHLLTCLGSIITAVTTIQRVLALIRSRPSPRDLPHSQQDLKSATLHVTSFPRIITRVMQSSHSIFGLARSRPAPNIHDDLLPHSHQEGLKSTTLHVSSCTQVATTSTNLTCFFSVLARLRPARKSQHDLLPHSQQEDSKSLTLRLLPRLQVSMTAAVFLQRAIIASSVAALARLRPAKNIHLDLLLHSQPSMTPQVFPCLQVSDMITALLHCLLLHIRSWLAQAGLRPDSQ
jgi:hypothetical protein